MHILYIASHWLENYKNGSMCELVYDNYVDADSCIMQIASLNFSTKHGEVQSNFEGDKISNKGGGSGVGIGDA